MDAVFRWLYMLHDGWLFAAVTALLLVVLSQVMHEETRKQAPEGKKPYFPYMVFYYGEVYEWCPRMPGTIFPKYLAYYGVVVTIMGGLEWIVEGAPGLVVKLELWGLVGGILGYWLFVVLGALVGAPLYGVWLSYVHKNKKVSIASIIDASMSMGVLIGAFLGLLIGMLFFHYNFALMYKLNFWVGAIVALVPVLIGGIELSYKLHNERKIGKFVNRRCVGGVNITYAPPYTFTEKEKALPEIVIPRDPKARKFDEK